MSVLVVLGMVLNLWLRREPKYHGKTVSAWVDDLGDNPGHRQRFQLAMDEIGPAKACPFLLARLRREESVLRRRCQAVWPCLPAFLQRRFPLSRPLDCNTCETVGYVLRSSDSALTTTLMSALSDRTGGVRLAALTAL